MKVLILSPYPESIGPAIMAAGDTVITRSHLLSDDDYDADFIVAFGHRHIISQQWLQAYRRESGAHRIINIHLSMLPWNRGAHPNFWSYFDCTPRGVTIHDIDGGIDTGDILVQAPALDFGLAGHTLRTSYNELRALAVQLMTWHWPQIRIGKIEPRQQLEQGSYHTKADIDPYWEMMPLGWDTPVSVVTDMGRKARQEEEHERAT